jgi:predicted nucleic acid-binding protein
LILLDTSVLSLAFRRRRRPPLAGPDMAAEIERLIELDLPLAIPGVVIQELLSGIREAAQFRRLRRVLEGFPAIAATIVDHLAAAEIANACRAGGIAATTIDCLIAAQAVGADSSLFTLDQDFGHIASCCGLELWSPPVIGR